MSTTLHPDQHHTRIYVAAAAALAVGLLIVLMTTVFGASDSVPGTPGGGNIGHGTLKHAGRAYAPPCFAGRPGGSIELLRSGCRA